MSEEKKETNLEAKTRLFNDDITKAMDLTAKAQAKLGKALGRLPKTKPLMIPAESHLSKQGYSNTSLQDVLKDLYLPAAEGKLPQGVCGGLIDTCSNIQKLVSGGEGGFSL